MFVIHHLDLINPKPNPAASRASVQLERTSVHSHRAHHDWPSHGPTSNIATDTDEPVETVAMNRLKQAAEHTKDVATLPPRLLEMYSDFITKNAGAVGQVEGALRSLTYLIPG